MRLLLQCPICGRQEWSLLTSKPIFNNFNLIKCINCSIVVKVTGRNDKIHCADTNQYIDPNDRVKNASYLDMAHWRLKHLKRFLKSGQLLEIGSATGEFLEEAERDGFAALGIDASIQYATYARSRGSNIICGDISCLSNSTKFDGIMISHLLEHICNPKKFMQEVLGHLKIGGLAFIITPNRDALTDVLLGYMNPKYLQDDHILFYSVGSINRLLSDEGFEVLNISSKEYMFHPLTSLIAFLKYLIKFKLYRRSADNSVKENIAISKKFNIIKHLFDTLPRVAAFLLSPLLFPYGVIIDRFTMGHELVVVARKTR